MNVTVQHLTSTGIGRTVNILRKDDGEIGSAAKALISKWKQMVANQESDGEDDQTQEQDSYQNDDESSKLMAESISNNERKSHKTHEHMPRRRSSSSSNQHHHNQYQTHEHGKSNDSHTHKRKVRNTKIALIIEGNIQLFNQNIITFVWTVFFRRYSRALNTFKT